MENKAVITKIDREFCEIVVQCPGFTVQYLTDDSAPITDISSENGHTTISIFTTKTFEVVLKHAKQAVENANEMVAAGCDFAYSTYIRG